MNNQIMKLKITFVSVILLLSGCVTESTSPNNSKADPDKALHTYVELGLQYLQLGKTQQAKPPIQRALEINGKSPEANAAAALMYQRDAEPALAEQYFKKALEYDDKYTTGRNNYGMFLYAQGRYDEALAQLKIAADDTFFSKRAEIFYNIGLVYLKMNKSAEADAAFNKSKILNGNNPDTYLEIAQINFDNKAYAQANDAYNEFLKIKPQPDARGLLLGIRLSQAMGKKEDVLKYAEQLKKSYPTSDEYFVYTGSARNQ